VGSKSLTLISKMSVIHRLELRESVGFPGPPAAHSRPKAQEPQPTPCIGQFHQQQRSSVSEESHPIGSREPPGRGSRATISGFPLPEAISPSPMQISRSALRQSPAIHYDVRQHLAVPRPNRDADTMIN
jgi:hypothetical protein